MHDGQLDIVEKTLCKKQRSLATTVASTVRYTLSSLVTNCLKIYKCRVYNSSTDKWDPVVYKTQEFLDNEYPGWETADTSTPLFYLYDVELDEFILYPSADSNHVGTEYLQLFNVIKPVAISSDSESPDLPETLHPALVEYVVATGLESRGYQDIADNHWEKYSVLASKYVLRRSHQPDEEVVMGNGREG